MFTLQTYYNLYIFHNVKFVCLLHLVCTIHRNNNVAMMAAATCGKKVTCLSEINISLRTETRACKYLIITIDGADLFCHRRQLYSCNCANVCRYVGGHLWLPFKPQPTKTWFQGCTSRKKKTNCNSPLVLFLLPLCIFLKGRSDTWPPIWKDD